MSLTIEQTRHECAQAKSPKQTLRAARRQERKQLRRIERAVQAGRAGVAKHHQRRYLRSWSSKLVHVARANRRLSPKRRVPFASLADVARQIDPWVGTDETVLVHQFPKSSGGLRMVHDYGLLGRALQQLVARSMKPFANLDARQHSTGNGGRERAVERVIEAMRAGYKWFIRLDIQDYYPSIDERSFRAVVVAPQGVIENTLRMPVNVTVGFARRNVDKRSLVQASRRGLSQGASSSPIIADLIVTSIFRSIPRDAMVVNVADDFAIMARTKREAIALQQALISAARRCPHGHFQLLPKSDLRRVSDGFAFLGYDFSFRKRVLKCTPSTTNLAKFLIKAARLIARIDEHRVNRTRELQRLLRSWRSAFRHWDAGPDCFAPRSWVLGAAEKLQRSQRIAVQEAMRWHEGNFLPTRKWSVLDAPPSCFVTGF